ncbi:MAG: hypothetical protein Tsb004_31420 [Allomuricauda sp.]
MRLDKRNKLLIGGFVLALVVCYQLAIKKTLALHTQYVHNSKIWEQTKDLPQKLANLKKQEQQLDTQFADLNLESANMQNELLRFLNEQGREHSVKVIDFSAPHVIPEGETTTSTYQFILEGGFRNILKVSHALEIKGNFGGITHMAFEKEKNLRNGRTYLRAQLHLRQIE